MMGLLCLLAVPATASATKSTTFGPSLVNETLGSETSGTLNVPIASFDPGRLDFGQLRLGQDRTLTLTVTNTGDMPLVFMDGGYIDGAAAGRFQIVSDNCSGNEIAPNGTCDVRVKATSNATGPVSAAELKLVNNGFESAQGVALSFTGINPGVNTVPSNADFGAVEIGDQETQFFNIESNGTTALEITDFEVESSNTGDFALPGPGCVGSYAPDNECQVQVTFQPQPGEDSVRMGQIQFQTNASDGVTVIPIQGTATEPQADRPFPKAELTVNFPKKIRVMKTTKIKVRVTVANTGSVPLAGARLAFSVRQGNGNPKVSGRVSLAPVKAKASTGKTVTIKVKRSTLKRKIKSLKLNVEVIQDGTKLAAKTGTTRLDFGQAQVRRPQNSSR